MFFSFFFSFSIFSISTGLSADDFNPPFVLSFLFLTLIVSRLKSLGEKCSSLDDHLSDVLAGEQADESLGQVLETVDHRLLHLQLP